MAVEVGSAYVTLIPSMRGFSAATQRQLASSGVGVAVERQLTSRATRAGSRAGGLFSSAFSRSTRNTNFPGPSASLLRNIRTYAYTLTGIGSITVGLGLKTASFLEQSKIAFTTILGSAKAARAEMAGLTKFAENTPFDLTGVVSASQQLLAFGFTAKQTIPTLRALGDAAAGLNLGTQGLQQLTTAIGQIQAKGRVQSDELLQLTEARIPALKILANTFGTTTAAMQDMVTKGLVPADKAIPALLAGIEHGTNGIAGQTARFGGLMRKQSHTLGGVISNLKDTVSTGLAKAVKPLVPVLERVLPKAMKALPGIFRSAAHGMRDFLVGLGAVKDRTPGAASGFEQFGSAVKSVAGGIRSVFNFIGAHAGTFKVLTVAVLGGVAAFKALKIVGSLAGLFAPLVGLIGRMVGAQWALNAAMDANPIGAIVTAIGALAAGLIYAYKTSETFRNVVKGVFHVLERVVGAWVSFTVRGFKFVLDTFFTVVSGILHGSVKMMGWVPGLGGKLKSASKAFDGFRHDVDSKLSGIASDAWNLGTDAGNNYAGGFSKAIQAAMNAGAFNVITGSESLGDRGNFSKTAKRNAQQAAKQVAPTFSTLGSDIGTAVSDGVKKSSSKVAQSAKDLADKILGPLRALRQKAAQVVSSIMQAVTGDTGFGALTGQTDSLGASMGTNLKTLISGLAGQRKAVLQFRRELRELGRRGLSEGAIQEIAGMGLTAGGGLADTLTGATRKQLRQISSLRSGIRRGAHGIGVDAARNEFGSQIAREIQRTTRAVEEARRSTELGDKTIRKLDRALNRERKNDRVYLDTGKLDRHNGREVLAQ